MSDPYEEIKETDIVAERQKRLNERKVYYDFLLGFKENLSEFIKESAIDLTISELVVDTTPQELFSGESGGMYVTLKNQGDIACFISTDKRGAFRLDPAEKEKFWLNKKTIVVTQSGNTILGFIRN